MSHYTKGDRFEKRVQADLQANGYLCWQTRQSRSASDLFACKRGQILLVQVKTGQATISHIEWNTLQRLARHGGALALVADHVNIDGRGHGDIRYRRITAQHVERSQFWPWEAWTPDEVEGSVVLPSYPSRKG